MENTIQEEEQRTVSQQNTAVDLDDLNTASEISEPVEGIRTEDENNQEITFDQQEQQDMVQPNEIQIDEITLDQTENQEKTKQELEASFPNDLETTNENAEEIAEETHLDATEQTLDTTADENKELTQSMDDTNDKEDSESKRDPEIEAIQQHKKELISKRKARNQNRFADGNLIPEEIDEETGIVRSPGPPPLEPISQNLDDINSRTAKINVLDVLGTSSPDKIDMTLDEEYQELDVEIKPSREEIVAKFHAIIKERDDLQNTNSQLHHKLADYFRKKKSEEAQNQPLFDKSSQEQEQRYLKYLSTIEQLRKQLERERLEAEREIDDLKDRCEMKQHLVNEDRMHFIKSKREAANKSISLHTGKAPSSKEIDAIMQREQQKEYEVVSVRLENIKLKNQLKKREMELKAKEELGEGLHMIDFEQLKIENQTYNEKIEERNEELMKLKKKINNTVQILTHVKEKLQFVLAQNEAEKTNLNDYDETVKKERDILNKIKQSRDSLRVDNVRLKQNSGLLGNTVLLIDFEECVDKNDNIESQIEQLKRKHAELVLNSKGLKQKIAQTKPDKQSI